MKILKNILIFPIILSTVCPLVSCSNDVYDVKPTVSIKESDTVQSSCYTLCDDSPSVSFPFQLDGILDDDLLSLSIIDQTRDGVPGSYIQLKNVSGDIPLKKYQTSVSIEFQLTDFIEWDNLFEVKFSVSCAIIRQQNYVFKTEFKNLFFENATPTTPDMFEYEYDSNNNKILHGWNDEEWVTKEIIKCNVFLLPDDVVKIDNNAFFDSDTQSSIIPHNIQYIYLNSTYNHYLSLPSLSNIGNFAFSKCTSNFPNLSFPHSLTAIGDDAFNSCNKIGPNLVFGEWVESIGNNAFANCESLESVLFSSSCSLGEKTFYQCSSIAKIDVAGLFDNVPGSKWLEKDTFAGLSESGVIFVSSPQSIDIWQIYFESVEDLFKNWIYQPKIEC